MPTILGISVSINFCEACSISKESSQWVQWEFQTDFFSTSLFTEIWCHKVWKLQQFYCGTTTSPKTERAFRQSLSHHNHVYFPSGKDIEKVMNIWKDTASIPKSVIFPTWLVPWLVHFPPWLVRTWWYHISVKSEVLKKSVWNSQCTHWELSFDMLHAS